MYLYTFSHRYCAIVNPIRHHVANLSAKRLTILTTLLIWILAIVLAMPAVLFSHVMSIPIFFGNCTNYVLICNPYPEEYGKTYNAPERKYHEYVNARVNCNVYNVMIR